MNYVRLVVAPKPEEPVEFGKYRLIRRIATGGMAEIYLAVQQGPHGFEKVVVVKVILEELCANDDLVHMFLDEARIAANLDHNNVVRVYDFGEVGGRYYLTMEHLPGEDVLSILQMLRRAQRSMPIGLAGDIAIGAARGLEFAHEQQDGRGRPLNIVHRDVSPSNIVVTYHGTVKLLDFGIARAESNITKTAAGAFKGKVAYVSPEQALGEPVDRRSDVFSLGVVLYEAVTMMRPFKRESELATLKAVIADPVAPPSALRPEVPPELDAIILKAMAKAPSARYQTAAELADALARLQVQHQYERGEAPLAELLTGLFDEERRQGKLRVSQLSAAGGAPLLKTPSQLNELPANLSVVRGSRPSPPPLPPLPSEVTVYDETRVPAAAPRRELEEPPPEHRRRLPLAALLGVPAAAALVALTVIGWPSEPQSERPPPERSAVTPVTPVPSVPPVPAPPPVEPPVAPPVEPPSPELKVPEPTSAESKAPTKAKAKALRGKLTLDTAPWSEVFLHGRKLGDTPLVEYSLPPGLHTLTLVNEAKGVHQVVEIEVEAGKTTVTRLKL